MEEGKDCQKLTHLLSNYCTVLLHTACSNILGYFFAQLEHKNNPCQLKQLLGP